MLTCDLGSSNMSPLPSVVLIVITLSSILLGPRLRGSRVSCRRTQFAARNQCSGSSYHRPSDCP
jgi:hypothetical protein